MWCLVNSIAWLQPSHKFRKTEKQMPSFINPQLKHSRVNGSALLIAPMLGCSEMAPTVTAGLAIPDLHTEHRWAFEPPADFFGTFGESASHQPFRFLCFCIETPQTEGEYRSLSMDFLRCSRWSEMIISSSILHTATYVTMSSPSRHNICLYKSCTTGKQKHLGPSEPVAHPTNITIPTIPSKLRPEKEQQKSSSTMPKPQERNWINIIASWWNETQPQGPQGRFFTGGRRSDMCIEIVIGKSL